MRFPRVRAQFFLSCKWATWHSVHQPAQSIETLKSKGVEDDTPEKKKTGLENHENRKRGTQLPLFGVLFLIKL